jgi:Ribosome-associated protein Y (PSrp-1)
MHMSISGHQLDVTDALKQYVEEKLERIERMQNTSPRSILH